ncbi:lipopolysaccharide biosynthesis protein [Devosia rhizoryzae]|uniref:Membrane protein involved in the export of O-antigen and teichoic acid n=1 Tax=Devosia rhizoryzae TaxID=2774137 RepID=A0ABX7CC92_9HYPH|nr:hypothetical protein [Devosia rhizoryzae]QQR40377.1 hypothetical protein JI748_05065 [Devosia rhizoryzae]
MTSAVARRIVQGTVANLLGKLWVVGLQLLMLPVLTWSWGADGYGSWLILTTIPTYLALSDAGLGTVAAVDLTRKVVSGDGEGALEVVQSLWALMTTVSFGLALLLLGGSAVAVLHGWFVGSGLSPEALLATIFFITAYALVVVQMLVLNVVYRATNKYALGTLLMDIATPVEGVVVMSFAWLGRDIATAAFAMLTVRALFAGLYVVRLRQAEPWCVLGFRHARWSTVRRLFGPSAAAFSLVGANAVVLQGMVLVLGANGGPVVAGAFAASRMISRVPLQLANLLSRASVPELTRAEASGDWVTSGRLLTLNVASALALCLPSALMLCAFGPQLLRWMSNDALAVDTMVFAWLAASAVAGALWTSASSRLVASNELGRFSFWYLAACLAATGWVLFSGTADLRLAAIALLGAELVGLASVSITVFAPRFVAEHEGLPR